MSAYPPGAACSFLAVIDMGYMVYFNFFGCVALPLLIVLAIYCYIYSVVRRQIRLIAIAMATNQPSAAAQSRLAVQVNQQRSQQQQGQRQLQEPQQKMQSQQQQQQRQQQDQQQHLQQHLQQLEQQQQILQLESVQNEIHDKGKEQREQKQQQQQKQTEHQAPSFELLTQQQPGNIKDHQLQNHHKQLQRDHEQLPNNLQQNHDDQLHLCELTQLPSEELVAKKLEQEFHPKSLLHQQSDPALADDEQEQQRDLEQQYTCNQEVLLAGQIKLDKENDEHKEWLKKIFEVRRLLVQQQLETARMTRPVLELQQEQEKIQQNELKQIQQAEEYVRNREQASQPEVKHDQQGPPLQCQYQKHQLQPQLVGQGRHLQQPLKQQHSQYHQEIQQPTHEQEQEQLVKQDTTQQQQHENGELMVVKPLSTSASSRKDTTADNESFHRNTNGLVTGESTSLHR